MDTIPRHTRFYYSNEDGLHFEAGNSKVWRVKEGWMVADLIQGEYKKHFRHVDLEEAIKDCLFRHAATAEGRGAGV